MVAIEMLERQIFLGIGIGIGLCIKITRVLEVIITGFPGDHTGCVHRGYGFYPPTEPRTQPRARQ